MPFNKKIFSFIITLFGLFANVCGQNNINYPVSVTPVIYPPYPSSILFINNSTVPNIYLTITNKSSNASILNVLLNVSIKTNSFTAQSKPNTFSTPITLVGNSPTRITNLDITSLYSFSNLTGVTLAQFQGTFPQSTIVFSFVLYDAATKRQVSQVVDYSVTYTVNNPPITSMPADKSVQVEQGIQNLLFQWQPRQATSSNGVQYIIQIAQLLSDKQDPQTAFYNSSNVFFTDSTLLTNYYYGSKNPQLLTNKTYAWRVQAKPIDNGGFTSTTFVNNGYSNVSSFSYSAPCKQPAQVQTETIDSVNAKVSWTSFTDNQTFAVLYRKQGQLNWITQNVPLTSPSGIKLVQLEKAASYELQVQGTCYAGISALSDIVKFKMPTPQAVIDKTATVAAAQPQSIKAVCGQVPPAKALISEALSSLKENDVIKAGDYSIVVGSGVSGGGGMFSGSGTVDIWLAGHVFKTKVSFTQVKVNKNYEVIDGAINLSTR
ncbi:MAG: hypothetical protein JWN76_559 [Chitinophagaceae bacterium]|nr:hypothetical protein [Chitinophagaceae bacterium]